MKFTLTKALRSVAVVIILISIIYVYFGIYEDMWESLWFIYLSPLLAWWLLDLRFNYTKGSIFYRGFIPFILVLYLGVSLISNEWVNTLIILTFLPFFVLIYNAKFYPLKYSIIPIIASFILILYLGIGLFLDIWHPTWMMFIIVPLLPLVQNYE